jgi:hypothetical protein
VPFEPGEIRNGRFPFPRSYDPDIAVFDVIEGRAVFTAPDEPNVQPRPALSPPVLSASGRAVYGGDPTTLWEVDSGVVLWRPLDHESAMQTQSSTHFHNRESWHMLWKRWLPNWKYQTTAYRSLETGKFLFRVPHRSDWPLTRWNADGTLGVSFNGDVFRTPPSANWPLLALCQFILALPLVLLWALLRWHRNKRALSVSDGSCSVAAP